MAFKDNFRAPKSTTFLDVLPKLNFADDQSCSFIIHTTVPRSTISTST